MRVICHKLEQPSILKYDCILVRNKLEDERKKSHRLLCQLLVTRNHQLFHWKKTCYSCIYAWNSYTTSRSWTDYSQFASDFLMWKVVPWILQLNANLYIILFLCKSSIWMFLYYLLNSSSFDPKFGRKDLCYPIETDRQLLRHSSAISLYT